MEISIEKIDELMADEKQGFITYSELGLSNLAKDEAKHYNYLKKLKQEKYGC